MAERRHSSLTRAVSLATLAAGALLAFGCARPAPKSDAPRPQASMDSALLAQCYTPPETTATGQVGCVLRDQGIRIGRKPVPKDP